MEPESEQIGNQPENNPIEQLNPATSAEATQQPLAPTIAPQQIQPPRNKRFIIGTGIIIALALCSLGLTYGKSWYNQKIQDQPTTSNTSNTTGSSKSTTPTITTAAACSLPTHDVATKAYTYGAPEGWVVEQGDTTLAIMEDSSNTTATYIYTAKLERDAPADKLLQQFGEIFKNAVQGSGGTFALASATSTTNGASAPISATVNNQSLSGTLTVVKDSNFATMTIYWAPTSDLSTKETQLKQIASCYHRTTALTDEQLSAASAAANEATTKSTAPLATSNPWGPLVSGRDSSFTFQAPDSWTSNVSSSYGDSPSTSITINAPDDTAAVAFLYNLGRNGVSDTKEFARTAMRLSYSINASLSNYQKLDGDIDAYDFSGTFQGKSVRGAVAVKVEPYQTFFAHYVGVQIANADLWDTYAPTLNTIQASIRLTDASREVSSLPPLPNYSTEQLFGSNNRPSGSAITSSSKYADEVEDAASDNWASAMRGYETTESPSTGNRYDVPINAWDPHGEDGAGYYRSLPGGGVEKLNVVN